MFADHGVFLSLRIVSHLTCLVKNVDKKLLERTQFKFNRKSSKLHRSVRMPHSEFTKELFLYRLVQGQLWMTVLETFQVLTGEIADKL